MTNKTIQLQKKVFSARCTAENYFDRVLGELDRLMETCETLHPNTALKRENDQLQKQVEELTLKLNAVHHEAKMYNHTKQEVLDALHLCDGVRELTIQGAEHLCVHPVQSNRKIRNHISSSAKEESGRRRSDMGTEKQV